MTHYLDFLGSLLGLLSTLLLIRSSILAWPMGIASIVLNSILYWHSLLFADTVLQSLYLALYCYGWYYWKKGSRGHNTPSTIQRIDKSHGLGLIGLSVFSIAFISLLLIKHTSSTTPLSDAGSTVMALAAQWLTCKKFIENWILWFCNDLMYCCLYAYKGLPFHVAEHGLYLVLAIIGFHTWQKIEHTQSSYKRAKVL